MTIPRMMIRLVFCFVWVVLAGSFESYARWATPEDADVSIESQIQKFQVNADGSFELISERDVKVLREGGRTLATHQLSYNARSEELKILEAGTLDGKSSFPVEKEFIEDKPSASRAHGFDQSNIVTIAFPKVSIGSTLHLKYRRKRSEVAIPGHFSWKFDFGVNSFLKKQIVSIQSDKPLLFEKSDPHSKLKLTEKKNGSKFELTIELLSPIYTQVIDEPLVSVNPKLQTWVTVSTDKDYGVLGEKVAEQYEKVFSADLPPSFQKILEAAKAKSDLIEKLNTVTSLLAEEVRYMGDWRPVAGGHIPRELALVAKTRFGDCKDFSSATVAILRRMGINAHAAWVERSNKPNPLPNVAFDPAFNHAIVYAEHEGRVFWLDPTNFGSFAQGIFPDIIGREALVIEKGKSRLEKIPVGEPADSITSGVATLRLDSQGHSTNDTRFELKGRASMGFTGALLRESKKHIDHILITSFVEENRLEWFKIEDYQLSSRVVQDFTFRIQYKERDYGIKTTAGPAVFLPSRNVDSLLRLETKKRVSDVFLGPPTTAKLTHFYESAKIVGKKPQECFLKTPWADVSRKVRQTEKGFEVTDSRVLKASVITNEVLKSKPFEKFQTDLQKCFDRVAVVYEPLRTKPAAQANAKPYQDQDYRRSPADSHRDLMR